MPRPSAAWLAEPTGPPLATDFATCTAVTVPKGATGVTVFKGTPGDAYRDLTWQEIAYFHRKTSHLQKKKVLQLQDLP